MAVAMLVAVGVVGVVAALLVMHGTDPDDRVSTRWRESHIRERRDDA
jgi:hypothetical protein